MLHPLRRASKGTVGEILERAAVDLGSPSDALVLHDRTLVVGGECPYCGAASDYVRLAEAHEDEELRCGCGAQAPLVLTDRLSRARAERIAGQRWADLGLPAADVVTAVAADGEAHYLVGQLSSPTSPEAGNAAA
jgi:hypothetical protein